MEKVGWLHLFTAFQSLTSSFNWIEVNKRVVDFHWGTHTYIFHSIRCFFLLVLYAYTIAKRINWMNKNIPHSPPALQYFLAVFSWEMGWILNFLQFLGKKILNKFINLKNFWCRDQLFFVLKWMVWMNK